MRRQKDITPAMAWRIGWGSIGDIERELHRLRRRARPAASRRRGEWPFITAELEAVCDRLDRVTKRIKEIIDAS